MSRIILFLLLTPLFVNAQWEGTNPVYFNAGNVGIGTITPSQKLEVIGSILENSENAAFGIDAQSNARLGFIKKYGYYPVIASDNGSPIIFSQTNQVGLHTNIAGATLSERMRIDASGNVGIGTITPGQKLEVNGSILENSENVAFGIDAQMNARLGFIKKHGYYPVIASDNGSPIIFSQTNQVGLHTNIAGATLSERMRIDASGNVGIGTTAPDAKLAVKGTIHTQEVRVDLNGAVAPDYVFNEDYKLLSLAEIKTYIDKNKHLPEVPSAKEMEANGVNLGEMNMLLLKKIEELTLYVIEQNKRIEVLEKIPKN